MKKYLDNIIDALLEVHIFEMAVRRKEIIHKIKDLQDQIDVHVALIKLFPKHPARKHWIHEVNVWISKIANMRFDGNKTLKESDYFNALWADLYEHTNFLKDVMKNVLKQKKLQPPKLTDSEYNKLEDEIKEFFKVISTQLSKVEYAGLDDLI